ncbi:MAG: glycosyltransferase family 4 protein [Ignavibacteriales bacterium]|nr:glycosyltransferase family 4 protein [Ignavibacteriales bacterium]
MKSSRTQPLNILVFNWQDITHPLGGGAEVHLHEIFKRIVGRGHSVTLYCSMFHGAKSEEIIDGIRIIREGSRNLFNFFVPLRYRSQFRHEKYDIIIDDINKIPFCTPAYVREPILALVHHLFRGSIFLEASAPAALYVYLLESAAIPMYRDTPIAVYSESSRRELLRYGFRSELIHHVPIAISAKSITGRRRLDKSIPRVGYLGRLKKYKSVDQLLRAFQVVLKEIPNTRLSIIGDGDARPGLAQLARELRIDHAVTFTGFVDEKEKARLLSRMSLVVNTSAKEGWGLTVTEANASGVPVVASNVPGLRDSVLEGKTGLLYEYGNISQLARKMLEVLKDAKLQRSLSIEALRFARSLNWDSSAQKMLEVIQNTIATRQASPQARSS